jgi:type I restriction enzyme S subunit
MTDLPALWRLASLSELKADEPRAITDGPFGSNLTSAHYTGSGPRVVRLQNIGDGVFHDAPAHISEQHFQSLRAYEVLPGDLLIASLGETLPRACIAPATLGRAIVKADCIRVRLSPRVDNRWVMYALQRPGARKWAQEHRHGVGRPRLGLKVIRQIPIPLPPIDQQRRIVDILEDHLSRLDAAGGLVLQGTKRLAALRRSTLKAVINHSDRDRVQLGDVVERIEAGKSFGGATAPASGQQWGVIRVSAMTWGTFREKENKAVPDDSVNPCYEIRPGDLLVSRANTSEYVGASVLVEAVRPRLLLSDKSLRVLARQDVNPRWLWLALSSPDARAQISAKATGTKESMRNISQSALLSISIPNPLHVNQEADILRMGMWFDALRAFTTSLATAQRRAGALRRALLEAAFTGRLTGRASDLDRVEEMAGV